MAQKEKILIVGAGLCGTLLAIRLAQKGYNVLLHEKRRDMRKESMDGGRSINLALSDRGLMALKKVGLDEVVRKECIPMRGRMIHSVEGQLRFSPYSGRSEDYINSVSRSGLNITLLNEAEKMPNIEMVFESSCVNIDLEKGLAHFKNGGVDSKIVKADVIIGADGAGSSVRKTLMSRTTDLLFNYSQDFLRSGYKELKIPPSEDGEYRIDGNSLHIWPRGKFMMIALPNLDKSFTVTMFHPYEGHAGFNTINSAETIQSFFKEYYPDAMSHMPTLVEDYLSNPVGVLGTNKCYPWQAFGKTMVIGDAAHAIVPFYGQGMNASFEDVRILDEMIDAHKGDWPKILFEFQESRKKDADAIADLAIDNFYEMQDKVDDDNFMKKRKLEMQLEQKHKDYYSKYSLVTFRPELPYSEAMKQGRAQDAYLLDVCTEKGLEEIDLGEVYEGLQDL